MPLLQLHHDANRVFKTLYICDYPGILEPSKMQKFESIAATSATFHLGHRRHEFQWLKNHLTTDDGTAKFIIPIRENPGHSLYTPPSIGPGSKMSQNLKSTK